MKTKLSEQLGKERIVLDFEARNKEEAIASLAGMLVNGADRKSVIGAILEREKLGSTGIGHGVAVPHVRIDAITVPVVAFGRSAHPIDFGAIDGDPCSLFFVVMGPTRKEAQEAYLRTMAKISRLMRNADVREKLAKAPAPDAVVEIIASNE